MGTTACPALVVTRSGSQTRLGTEDVLLHPSAGPALERCIEATDASLRCRSLSLSAHRSLPQGRTATPTPGSDATCNFREAAQIAGQAKLSARVETEAIPPILMHDAHHTHHPSRDTLRTGCWDVFCPAGRGSPRRPTTVVTAPGPGGGLSGRAGHGEAGSNFREMRTIGMMRYRAFSMWVRHAAKVPCFLDKLFLNTPPPLPQRNRLR